MANNISCLFATYHIAQNVGGRKYWWIHDFEIIGEKNVREYCKICDTLFIAHLESEYRVWTIHHDVRRTGDWGRVWPRVNRVSSHSTYHFLTDFQQPWRLWRWKLVWLWDDLLCALPTACSAWDCARDWRDGLKSWRKINWRTHCHSPIFSPANILCYMVLQIWYQKLADIRYPSLWITDLIISIHSLIVGF